MIIRRVSVISGVVHEMDLPIQYGDLERWKRGALVQDAFPYLTPQQREFLLSGTTQEEWDTLKEPENE